MHRRSSCLDMYFVCKGRFYVRRNTGHIIADGCIIDRSNTLVLAVDCLEIFEVTKFPLNPVVQLGWSCASADIFTLYLSIPVDGTIPLLVVLPQRKGVVTFVESLGYIDVYCSKIHLFQKSPSCCYMLVE